MNNAEVEPHDTLAAIIFWTAGTDPISATNTVNISTATLGGGFRLTAPADMEQRTLTLYLGGRRTTGHLVARLSDHSQAPLDVRIENPANWDAPEQLQRYTITYNAAQAGQTLTVDWTIQRQEDPWASISLSAASLAGGE